jgi:uncharacterized protein YbjT (DUF2867 family)
LDPKRDTILITGATGKQGGAVARELLAAGCRLRAVTRKPEGEAARALAARGIEVLPGDFEDQAAMGRAMQGVWGMFAVQNTWEAGVEREERQGKLVAELARKAGVQHYVYSSVASAHRNTGIPHFDNKWRIEQTVRGLKFPSHVILRPVYFMENTLMPTSGLSQGKLVLGLPPDRPLQMVAVEDVGKYGARAFLHHAEMAGKEIDIAGDAVTGPQAAAALSEALGKPITFEQQPIAQARAFSEDYALMLEWFDRVGYNADIAGNERTYGIKPTRFREWAAAHRAALASQAGP